MFMISLAGYQLEDFSCTGFENFQLIQAALSKRGALSTEEEELLEKFCSTTPLKRFETTVVYVTVATSVSRGVIE